MDCEINFFNPLTAKLFNWNLHSLEVVSSWRDSQPQVSENYSDLTKWRYIFWNIADWCHVLSLTFLKAGIKFADKKKKTNISVLGGHRVNFGIGDQRGISATCVTYTSLYVSAYDNCWNLENMPSTCLNKLLLAVVKIRDNRLRSLKPQQLKFEQKITVNTRCCTYVSATGLTLVHRLRHWLNIKLTLVQHSVGPYLLIYVSDRQTDILLTEIKVVITDLFVIVIREIYVHVYTRMLVC